ncbi:MAG: hypothetical protein ABI687_06695 [Flavitalea sp.]
MIIAILADEAFREKFMAKPVTGKAQIVWADSLRSLLIIEAEAYIDLLFDMDRERIDKLKQLSPAPVLVQAVTQTISDIGERFIRIVGLPVFHKKSIAKIAVSDHAQEKSVKHIFEQLGMKFQFVRDTSRKEN